ncbi:hypothetical protein TELCIR_00085 [Teladorsagia circumcincta]|uniref:Uncharacterized protein n=1 Tax=Teladorsagia circumcincta TaxID=45464 RepID=A0A2G9V5N0_TELCI|nr:hypothetical protein TELCIR_00085 [Teladorsagia circumcincta]
MFFQFEYYTNYTPCPAAIDERGFGFKPRYFYTVLYNKTSSLILAKKYWQHGDVYINNYADLEYTGPSIDPKELGFGMFMQFLRNADVERRSDNPHTNGAAAVAKAYDGTKPPPPGTGNDFSKMYHGYPFILGLRITEKVNKGKGSRPRKLLVSYYGKCTDAGNWIANEGYYKLNDVTGSWSPIYYDPAHTDFYYR